MGINEMKLQKIDEIMKALNEELKPLFEELKVLDDNVNDINKASGENTLNQLIGRITKTARRHDLTDKIKLEGRDCVVGTNHNGLGYQQAWSSQLTALENTGYYDRGNEQILRDILFDKNAVIELTTIIKKSNQKTFLEVVKVLEKYGLKKSFRKFREENLDEVTINLDNKYIIEIDLSRHLYISFTLYDENKNELGSLSVNNIQNNLGFVIREEKNEELKKIGSFNYGNINIEDIKLSYFIAQHKQPLINKIKTLRTGLNGVKDKYEKEQGKIKHLLEPLLALENI